MGRLDLKPALPAALVRPARPADAGSISALEHASFPPEDRFPHRSWRRLLASASVLALVADLVEVPPPAHAGAIAWLLRSTSSTARMYSLAVHPMARGRGLARTLVRESLLRLPGRCTVLSLEVRPENDGAVGLYRSLGFSPIEGLADYYGPGQDGMRMRAKREAVAATLGT